MKLKITLTAFAVGCLPFAQAADILWSSSGGSAWLTGSNWTGSAVPTASDNAQFGANPTATSGTGINFSNTTNAGTQTNGQRIEDVGAIEITSARAAAMLVGNSSGTSGATGTLRLLGATVNSVSNTILRNNSTQSFTIQNTQSSGNQTMAVSLGNATANLVNVDSSGNIIISSNISGTSRSLTLNANSSGDLRLSGTNTWNGGTNITGGSSGGRLRVDAVAALPTTGTVAISTGGRMTLNVSGTYGGSGQALTFNPNQTLNPSLDILSGAAVSWQGTVAINADTRIEANGGAGSLTFSGNASGSGTLIKQAAGNLILSGTGNNLTGSTMIGNGTLTVNSGSSMGTGALTLAQTSTNATTVTLNNATQSIGSLASSWAATTGTIAQTLTLNGTALTINQSTNTTYGTGAVSTLTSTIGGTGSIIKSGTGTLTLTGNNTYSGTTSVNQGKLLITGNISTSITTVNNGGTLGGSGTLGAVTVKSGGTLAPGNSSGILNTGNISLEASSQLGIELNSATVGTGYDELNVTGTISLAGAISLTNGYSPADGTLFFILANDGTDTVTGTFSNAPVNNSIYDLNGHYFQISYAGNYTGGGAGTFTGGNDVVLMAVPEPASALLGGVGFILLLTRRVRGEKLMRGAANTNRR